MHKNQPWMETEHGTLISTLLEAASSILFLNMALNTGDLQPGVDILIYIDICMYAAGPELLQSIFCLPIFKSPFRRNNFFKMLNYFRYM